MTTDATADSAPPGELFCPVCERTFESGDRCPHDDTKLFRLAIGIDPLIGRELDGKFTILEKLGQGGMGAVYRGSQHSVGREVAIKVVSGNAMNATDAIKRFSREARLASRLSHPNAVGVHEFGQTEDGMFYLVMELVTGRTLDQVFKDEGVLKPERVVRIGMQICDALEGAHGLSIVHRDLKPANIMLLDRGRDLVKVLDFGLAKSLVHDSALTTMTNAGALLGTPAFMPPELARGEPCDGRADLYSLGCVLYLIGSGHLPFESTSPHELIAMHAHDPAPPMTVVPDALARVVGKLLAKEPGDRYQNAVELREALEASIVSRLTPQPWDTNASVDTVAATSLPQMDITAPRRRWPLIALGVVAVAGIAAVAITMLGRDKPPVDTAPAPAAAAIAPAPPTPKPIAPTPTPPPLPAPTPMPAPTPTPTPIPAPQTTRVQHPRHPPKTPTPTPTPKTPPTTQTPTAGSGSGKVTTPF